MFYTVTPLEWPQYTELEEWRKGRVSRETDATTLGLRYPSAPARRLYHEIVQVTRRHAGNARRLRQRRRADAIKLLSRLGREALELEVGKLQWEREGGELGQPRRRFPLACEIAVVLELDLGARDGVDIRRERHARRGEQRAQRRTGPARDGGHALGLRQRGAGGKEHRRCRGGRDRRSAGCGKHAVFIRPPPLCGAQLRRAQQPEPLGQRGEPSQRIVLSQQET